MNTKTKITLSASVRVCMLSTLVWGVLAHGTALVTKFAMADEAHYLFSVGATASSGRWFLGLLGGLVQKIFGSPNFSLPLWGGLWTLFFTGLCACTLVFWLDLKKKSSQLLASGLMTVFPVMSGLFFYNFTAPYYAFGLLLVFQGGCILCRKRGPLPLLAAAVLVCLGLSIYQAFLPLFLSLLLISFLKELSDREQWSSKSILGEILWYFLGVLLIAAMYLLSVKLSTALVKEGLTDYKGISTMGSAAPAEYLHRIKAAIYLFFLPAKADRYAFLFPYQLLNIYRITLVGLGGFGAWLVFRFFCQSPAKAAAAALALLCFPLAVNFIYVVCAQEDIYNLMLFGLLAPFLLLVCFTEWLPAVRPHKAASVLLLVFCLFCIRTDNAVYARGQLIQQRTISYFTSMIASIKSVPGYTASTPVAFVGNTSYAMDPTFQSIEGYGGISMAPLPYDASPFSIGYSWQDFLTLWCGFTPPYADTEDYAALPEVQEMPSYPDSGSIRIVDGAVIVKLRDVQP